MNYSLNKIQNYKITENIMLNKIDIYLFILLIYINK